MTRSQLRFTTRRRHWSVWIRAVRLVAVLAVVLAGLALMGGSEGLAPLQAEPDIEAGGLRVSVDTDRNELILEMEPVELPVGAGHHDSPQPPTQYGVVPVNAWVHGYTVEMVDGSGRLLPRTLLHHVNIIAPDRRELFSPIMQRIGAAGTETAPVALPGWVGYPVDKGDRILLTGMLHNPTPQAYKDARIRVRMPLSSRERRIHPLRVYPFYVDVMPPASVHRFDLPPGRSEQSWKGRPAVAGRILGMGGHLHQHAVALRFEDLTTNQLMLETRPLTDESGALTGMPQHRMWWRLGLPIRNDHVYRLTVVYENPTSDTIHSGGMGALGGIIVPRRGSDWPRVDATNPEYRLDVRLTEAGAAAHRLVMGDLDGAGATSARNGQHTHGTGTPAGRH